MSRYWTNFKLGYFCISQMPFDFTGKTQEPYIRKRKVGEYKGMLHGMHAATVFFVFMIVAIMLVSAFFNSWFTIPFFVLMFGNVLVANIFHHKRLDKHPDNPYIYDIESFKRIDIDSFSKRDRE